MFSIDEIFELELMVKDFSVLTGLDTSGFTKKYKEHIKLGTTFNTVPIKELFSYTRETLLLLNSVIDNGNLEILPLDKYSSQLHPISNITDILIEYISNIKKNRENFIYLIRSVTQEIKIMKSCLIKLLGKDMMELLLNLENSFNQGTIEADLRLLSNMTVVTSAKYLYNNISGIVVSYKVLIEGNDKLRLSLRQKVVEYLDIENTFNYIVEKI